MQERIVKLVKNQDLEYLMQTPEFAGARSKLLTMLEKLEGGLVLSVGEYEYIEKAEAHIKLIQPHWETMIVNGEESLVWVLTVPAEICA